VRILIADDNQLVRRGITGILLDVQDYKICGEAADAKEMIQKALELHPDLVLLDVSMPDMNGLDAARVLRKQVPDIKILVISQHDPRQLLPRSLEAGANGCVDKARVATDLLPAIQSLFRPTPPIKS
jgi:two-component system, NarL family, response regulator NreC